MHQELGRPLCLLTKAYNRTCKLYQLSHEDEKQNLKWSQDTPQKDHKRFLLGVGRNQPEQQSRDVRSMTGVRPVA
jgi:hypothetical protein